MEEEYTCSKCGTKGVRSSLTKPNFKCIHCGFIQDWFWRKELMDLNDPVEGELALEIFTISCGWKEKEKGD